MRAQRPTSWNRYLYCHDDPVNCFDPTGLVDWSQLLVGAGQVGLGILGIGGATVAGASGQLPLTIFLAIGSGGSIATGFSNVVGGLLAPGNQVSPNTASALTLSGQLGTPGGLVGGVFSGGSPTAIQVGALLSATASTASDLFAFVNSNTALETFGALAGVASDLNDIQGNLPHGPVVGPPTSITVTDAPAPIEPVSSPIPSGLDYGSFCGPDESWDGEGCAFARMDGAAFGVRAVVVSSSLGNAPFRAETDPVVSNVASRRLRSPVPIGPVASSMTLPYTEGTHVSG